MSEIATVTGKTRPAIKNGAGRANDHGKPGMFDFLYTDIAIDLGTANTLIVSKNAGLVYNEPSIIALDGKNLAIAIGHKAQLIHEKSHSGIRAVRPLRDGVIADYEVANLMIDGIIKLVKRKWYATTRRIVICVPSGITEVERRAVRDSAKHAGGKEVYLVEEPMAAAIGVGLDIHEPMGNMIVDIGGGTTEIAVIALSGVVHAQSLRLGGDFINDVIIRYLKRNHNLYVGERTAERIKCEIGSATPLQEELETSVKGRDLVSGMPIARMICSEEIREAMEEAVNSVIQAIMKSLERTPPELSCDLLESGIVLAGGGALLKNLDRRINEATGLPVRVADDPLTAVVRGTGMILENIDEYRGVISGL